jgi:hypothetical protein
MKLNEKFPIGEIRERLLVEGPLLWNAYVRDMTAEMEAEWVNKFQPKLCCCFPGSSCDSPCNCTKKPDTVEEKIEWLIKNQKAEVKKAYDDGVIGNGGGFMAAQWIRALRELVELARTK